MITNFEDYTHDLTASELQLAVTLAQVLRARTGKYRAITNKGIQEGFSKNLGVNVSGARVRKLIRHIRMTGMVTMLISTSRGYYVASNKKEFRKCMKSIEERADAIRALYNAMEWQFTNCQISGSVWTPNTYHTQGRTKDVTA